ncbi:IncW plasmid conjugative relaxase protein TrwC (TraI homolog) [Sphingobium indicum BiD32]|uniref:IncW plasmid conjugative relaxase protein TrwC (TraI homolog) n=1 Tax=Sphingobium indicum BiD32 TaxID=1301087 RepID=N1MPD0_9SPHN|nr:IncW plasmid conjugative relaxase protein TrwC (TraI homolog) [Sphingobium indicum BiD32]
MYSAQSKTYDRAYVLAPVNSGLVTGQNYYTAITRARYGVKLWTEDRERLVDKLERHSGEKTSALEGLGRLDRDSHKAREERHAERWDRLRDVQRADREERKDRMRAEREARERPESDGLAHLLAGRAQSAAEAVDRWLTNILTRSVEEGQHAPTAPSRVDPAPAQEHDHGAGHDH